MRPNFVPLTLAQFQLMVSRYRFKRRITMVHVHHTWRPRKVDYRGVSTIQGMWRYHTQEKGWQDIAQHVTIAPDGTIWTGRSWDLPPVSSVGHNGNAMAGPFMFEIIGDFDTGKEKLEGAQRAAVCGVIAAVQLANRLPAEAFRFHRELGSPKTCPGSGVAHDKLLGEVQTARTSAGALTAVVAAAGGGRRRGVRAARAVPFAPNDQEAVDQALAALHERSSLAPDASEAEDTHDDDVYAARVVMGRDLVERAPGARGPGELDASAMHALRPHVVNLRGGLFSSSGEFQTAAEDVDRLFDEHLPAALAEAKGQGRPLRVLFWAHGGLTDEKRGLSIAARQVAWWKRIGVYPIHFVWETGLMGTVGQLLRSARGNMRAIDTRDLWDHTTDPLIEVTARALGGEKVWSGMKFSAERASAPGGGAAYVARRLARFCKEHKGTPFELHAVGHSAGSIFHAHFVPAALREKSAPFTSLHFLAPAIRIDEFQQRLEDHLGTGIEQFTMFTMAKDWERGDNVNRVYRKSLLYLVSHAFEPNGKTPILGLEEHIRADARCRKLFGLEGGKAAGEVIWSKTTVGTGLSATTAIGHGDFDEDVATMNSVARRILRDDDDALESFPAVPLSRAADSADELPAEVAWVSKLSAAPAASEAPVIAAHDMPSGAPMVAAPIPGGKGVALCIGIDDYPQPEARLNGCVNDARAWAAMLGRLGFETQTLVNEQATRAGIVSSVTALLAARQPGDIMVLQYSGHGTRLPDVDGDEDDSEDEAMCAFDYADGHFVIDDDLRALFAHIPKGVSLTCFFDCCHSGTITRVVQPKRPRARGVRGGAPRKRSLKATPQMVEAHRAFREKAGTRRNLAAAGEADMAEVVFTACRSDQVAYESDGQGDFTRIALELFQEGLPDESNDAFYQRILRGFGEDARQQPQLNSSATSRQRHLLARL